jgi:hypothetical protein
MNSVGILGTGRLGICTALTLENVGYNVHCYDVNPSIIDAINKRQIVSHEKNVSSMLSVAKNITGHSSLKDIMHLPLFFCVVATPSLEDGSYNHSYIESLTDEMIKLLPEFPGKKILSICCTTMPGYCDILQKKFQNFDVDVCYNPEFIAQGDILHGYTHPDIILIGEASKESGDVLEEVYKKVVKTSPTCCRMSRMEAEITKISINCFITTKISFANTIGDLCVEKGLRPDVVLKAIGSDSRIGRKYLNWGHGYGGPCFPRDNRALSFYYKQQGLENKIGEATDLTNKKHAEFLAKKLLQLNATGFIFRDLAYKPGTVILEESQSLALALALRKSGHIVVIDEASDVRNAIEGIHPGTFLYFEGSNDLSNYILVDSSLKCLL